jgi:hypothetical protein
VLKYKTFDPKDYRITNIDDIINIVEMFQYQFTKKECAMRPRDEKWAGGLQHVKNFLYQVKENQ